MAEKKTNSKGSAKTTKNKNLDYAYSRMANKIRSMIKASIKDLHLILTGLMYDSIFVYPDGKGGYDIEAEDYFWIHNERYGILDEIFNSRELADYQTKVLGEAIELELK